MSTSTHRLTAILDFRDRLTSKMRKSIDQVNRLKQSSDKVSKSLRDTEDKAEKTGRAIDKIRNASQRAIPIIKKLGTGIQRSVGTPLKALGGKTILEKLPGILNGFKQVAKWGTIGVLGGALIGGGAFVGNSFEKAMNFESQMASIQALTNITNQQLAEMQALALKAGADTKYSALEAAQGIEELVKAGLSPAQVQAGGLTSALNLATAGGLDLADAAEIMSTALNAFKRDGLTAERAADILAGTANASATDVYELQTALSQVSAVASAVGLSFEDVNAALGLFANNGLKSSDAGTSLKTMLQNLVPSTDSAYALFDRFNLLTVDTQKSMDFLAKKGLKPVSGSVEDVTAALEAYVVQTQGMKKGTAKVKKAARDLATANGLVHSAFYDEKGDLRGLGEIAGILQENFKDLSAEQRQTYFETIFGTDAIRAATLLYTEGADSVEDFKKKMGETSALDVARRKMDTAAGAVEQFSGAIETLQISALLPTMPIIKDLANAAADFVTKYTPQIQAAVQEMATGVQNYIKDNFTNNPEFQKLTTLRAKVTYVFDKLYESFQKWLDNGGRQQIQDAASSLTNMMITSLETYGPRISELMATIGKDAIGSFFKGMAQAYNLRQADNPLDKFLAKVWGKDAWGQGTGVMYDENGNPVPYEKPPTGTTPKGYDYSGSGGSFGSNKSRIEASSHAGGLERVPYNGYLASLHKGERVLTAEESEAYNRGGSGGGLKIVINKLADTLHVRSDDDIDKIAAALAREIKRTGGLMT